MKVHRLSPLTEEMCGWRTGAKPGAVAPAMQKGQQQQQQPASKMSAEATDPTPLLFALEDIPSPLQRAPSIRAGAAATTNTAGTVETLQLLLGPASDAEAMLHVHVKLAQELPPASSPPSTSATTSGSSDGSGSSSPHSKATTTALDPQELAEVFSRLGYAPTMRASNLKIAQRKGLQHKYLTVHVPDSSTDGGQTFIVDLAFKDQFVVASPTPRYAAVLDSLTPHVIATKGCLRQAVALLCTELAQCFAERGLPIPPWRTPAALLARWHLQAV